MKTTALERKIKYLIPKNIKKIIVNIISNSVIGYLLKKLKINKNLLGGFFDYSIVTNKEAALIFWGIWESAEIRFSKRFADTKVIIELGSSIGVNFGVLTNCLDNRKFICVEASKINFKKLLHLKNQIKSNKHECVMINKAIHYEKNKIYFKHISTSGSKLIKNNLDGDEIDCISLHQILIDNNVNENYTLISDIEGVESEIFFKDSESLKNCSTLIAELENTDDYSINDQVEKLIELNFRIIENYGNVFVFKKDTY